MFFICIEYKYQLYLFEKIDKEQSTNNSHFIFFTNHGYINKAKNYKTFDLAEKDLEKINNYKNNLLSSLAILRNEIKIIYLKDVFKTIKKLENEKEKHLLKLNINKLLSD